jgi:glycosyltransferase involved in cell wall biosynthesis
VIYFKEYQKMRICLYSDAPLYGGAEHYLSLLAAGLQQRGHSVTVLIREHDSLDRWAEELRRKQVGVIRGVSGYGLVRWLHKAQPDVMHINLPGPYNAGCGSIGALAKITGVPVVVTTEHLPGSVGSARFRLAKRFFGVWIDAIITETRTNVRYLTELHGVKPHKIACIYHGIDARQYECKVGRRTNSRKSLGLGPDDTVIALIGRLHPQKGHDYLLQAASRLKDSYPLCKYLFIGEGEWRRELESLVRQLSLQDKVIFLGFREDIPELLQTVDILAMPSRMEGLPFVLLEAMATGLPVVASDLECLREIISHGENGFLVPVGDSVALANLLKYLIENRYLWGKVGQKARETVMDKFSLTSMIDQTEGIYRDLLKKNSGPRGKLL